MSIYRITIALIIFSMLYLYLLTLQNIFNNIFLEAGIFFITVSLLFACLYKILVKLVRRTPIYVHPITRENKDLASISLALFCLMIILSYIISILSFCFVIPIYWQVIFPLVALGMISWLWYQYNFYIILQFESPRLIACALCRKPFQKYEVEINDFLTSTELENNRAGTTDCSINTALCPDCSFPLTRETLGLNIAPIKASKYPIFSECPQCKDYFQWSIGNGYYDLVTDFRHPAHAEESDKSVRPIASSQCRYCGYYSQSFPQFSLSSIKDEIYQCLLGHETRMDVTPSGLHGITLTRVERRYDSHKAELVIAEIEDMLECDSQDISYYLKNHEIIDYSDKLRKIRFLSTNDKRQAIEMLSQWTDHRVIIEKDWRSEYI